jgi:hypothetical protein
MGVKVSGTYTHLRPRSLQFEQDGCLPAFEMGRSLRSHLTLCVQRMEGEYGRMGTGMEGEQKGRSEVRNAEWR